MRSIYCATGLSGICLSIKFSDGISAFLSFIIARLCRWETSETKRDREYNCMLNILPGFIFVWSISWRKEVLALYSASTLLAQAVVTRVSLRHYLYLRGYSFSCRMIGEWCIGKDLEGISRGPIEIPSRNFPGGTEETRKILKISGILAHIRTHHHPNTILRV
jgi:hypothetical protein